MGIELHRGVFEMMPHNFQSLMNDCITDIVSGRFVAAAEKMTQMNSPSDINYIVNTVYDHKPGKFELVLEASKESKKVRPRSGFGQHCLGQLWHPKIPSLYSCSS